MIKVSELNELLVAHNCLHALSIQLNDDGSAYDLFLSMSASEKAEAEVVRIRFIGVSQFASRDFGGGLTQLMHMSVSKLDSGFDRMRYQLSDLEDKKYHSISRHSWLIRWRNKGDGFVLRLQRK